MTQQHQPWDRKADQCLSDDPETSGQGRAGHGAMFSDASDDMVA